jgi:hypothetical protein
MSAPCRALQRPRTAGRRPTPRRRISRHLAGPLYDCDWLPFERFEDSVTKIKGNELRLHGERYRALVVPPTESVTFATLEKARAFFEAGARFSVMAACRSVADARKTAADIARCRGQLGVDAAVGKSACRHQREGGRSFFLADSRARPSWQRTLARPACRLCCAYFQARPALVQRASARRPRRSALYV